MQNHELQATRHLRRWWLITAFVFAGALVGGAILSSRFWPANNVLRWSIITASVLLIELAVLWKNLGENKNLETGSLQTQFGPGNWLSLMRGMSIGLLAGFLFSPLPSGVWAWLPAILYTFADVSDYFDGFLARATGSVTKLGEILDLEWDALGLLIAVSLSIWYGILPLWFWPFGLARYLYVFALWIHRKGGGEVGELPASVARRPIAAITMGFMSVMLWPIVSQPLSTLAAMIVAIPFTAGFLRDWLVVTSKLNVEDARYRRAVRQLGAIFLNKLPVAMRLLVILAVVPEINHLISSQQGFANSFIGIGPSDSVRVLFAGVEVITLIMIFLGAAGRIAAFFLLIPLGLTISGSGLNLWRAVGLAGTLGVMIAGSGSWSLWKPEAKIFRPRAGEKT